MQNAVKLLCLPSPSLAATRRVCKQQIYLHSSSLSLASNKFPPLVELWNFHLGRLSVVLLFAAAPTAIWLIKSVIEFCVMNNKLLFSRLSAPFLSCVRSIFPFSSPLRLLRPRINSSPAWDVCCVCCIRWEANTAALTSHNCSPFALFCFKHKKQIVNINSKLLNMQRARAFLGNYFSISGRRSSRLWAARTDVMWS